MPALILVLIIFIFCGPALADEMVDKYMSRGAYLARMGDCTSCHTAPGQAPYSGGYEVHSPFGTIYGTNITPDPETGIGDYSFEDFTNAVRLGIAKDGRHLYPAMPYTSFTKASDADMLFLYNYFMHEVKPVKNHPPETKLSFPFNQRWGIRFWDWIYAEDERFEPDATRDEQWNRGAYLVQSLGHCSACHTPRGVAYQEKATDEKSSEFLKGEKLDNWAAANLRGDDISGLSQWSEADIAKFLKTGHAQGKIAFGNMREVVENSTQYLSAEDALSIAHYLKSIGGNDKAASQSLPIQKQDSFERPGAGIYASSCAGCHQPDGAGKLVKYPTLANNEAVMSKDPTSLIRIVLEGSSNPQVKNGPPSGQMPGFAKKLNDAQIAQVVTYIRQSWGNRASAVTEGEVSELRKKLQKQ